MYIEEKLIFLNIKSSDKRELLEQMCEKLKQAEVTDSTAELFKAIWEREESFSTGIGRNVAIPHGKCSCVKETKLLIAIIPNGVEYDALDGEPVNILIMFAVPLGKDKEYSALLAKISTFVRDQSNRIFLLEAKTEKEILEQIREVIHE